MLRLARDLRTGVDPALVRLSTCPRSGSGRSATASLQNGRYACLLARAAGELQPRSLGGIHESQIDAASCGE